MVTADAFSTKAATKAMLEHEGPVYLRLGRPNVSEIYKDGDSFEIGKANTVREGDDVTIIANGLMVAGAMDAATKLAEEGVSARVIDMHTIKPLDTDAIAKAARETGRIVVAEEHLAHGGLGSAVAMAVSQIDPVPMAFVNVGDCFAESGDPQGLLDKYGLTADAIVEAVKKVK
jgi:transketolase